MVVKGSKKRKFMRKERKKRRTRRGAPAETHRFAVRSTDIQAYHSLPVATGHTRVFALPSTSCHRAPRLLLRAARPSSSVPLLHYARLLLHPSPDGMWFFGAASIFRVLVASRPGRRSAPARKGCVLGSYASIEAVGSDTLQLLALSYSPRPILHPLSALYVPHWPSLRSVPEGMHHTYLTSMEAERRWSKEAMRLVVSSSTLPRGPTPPRGAPPFAVRLREHHARVLRM